ncbi:hypothetical protein UFOVP1158_41 [uncultured Caudovirales phage]|uniref:Uncharacterized protein n=1 Tax=uncultured Caudovirales phage TaxID=2100421 RepID=A0A6J5R2D6_9CAUD|nr:hypothetical protein UFOVP1158_41 [uncultured Caudovirales phage]
MGELYGQGDSGTFGFGGKKPKAWGGRKKFGAAANNGGNGGNNSGGGGGSSATVAVDTSAADKAKQRAKAKADAKAAQQAKADAAAYKKRNEFNPLLQKYLSPEELRKQASDLALLGAPSEESLKAQGAQQVAGITGLTNALQARLGGVNTQNIAGIAGLGQLYKDIAGQTQSAGSSAVAASGAAPALAAGGNPMVAANLANLTAQTVGLVPAAGAIGTGLTAEAGSNLTKALAARANNISENTAKYLLQLQNQEYTKATALETLKQNAALLGVKQSSADQTALYTNARIQNMQAMQNLGWAKLDASIRKINADTGKSGAVKAAAILDSILSTANTLTAPQKMFTGKQQYDVSYGDGKHKKVFANSAKGAAWLLRGQMGDADYKGGAYTANTTGRQETVLRRPSRARVEAQIRARLNNTSYTPAEIDNILITYADAFGLNSLPA